MKRLLPAIALLGLSAPVIGGDTQHRGATVGEIRMVVMSGDCDATHNLLQRKPHETMPRDNLR